MRSKTRSGCVYQEATQHPLFVPDYPGELLPSLRWFLPTSMEWCLRSTIDSIPSPNWRFQWQWNTGWRSKSIVSVGSPPVKVWMSLTPWLESNDTLTTCYSTPPGVSSWGRAALWYGVKCHELWLCASVVLCLDRTRDRGKQGVSGITGVDGFVIFHNTW